MATIQGVYIALFGRPADPLGLSYFNGVTKNGADLSGIGNLAGTKEYTDRFTGLSNTEVVNSIYVSLFGHDADLAGLTFFVNQLTSGKQTINTIAINILDGAQGDDKTIVANKLTAADLFTSHLDTGSEVTAYSGNDAAEAGRTYLSAVGVATTTIPTAAATDTLIANIVAGTNTGGTGQTFTLTVAGGAITGIDNIVGTNGDDTIRAITGNSLDATDIIKGGAGNDVLNISAGALVSLAAPIIDSVETINNADVGKTLDMSSITGTTKVVSSGVGAFSYTGAQLAETFAVGGAAGATTINLKFAGSLSGASDTVKIEVGNSTAGATTATFAFDAAQKANIEGVALTLDKGNIATTVLTDLTKLATVTIDGAGHGIVTAAQTTIEKFDASANTGGVEWTAGALAKAATITGSSANDTFHLEATTKAVTVSMGAGLDTVFTGTGDGKFDLGAGDDLIEIKAAGGSNSVTLGAGSDTVHLVAATSSIFTADLAHFTTITDFSATDDVLNIKDAGAFQAATQAENQAISTGLAALGASATLADAVAVVDAALAVNDVAVFNFGGNTYVFGDNNASNDGVNDVLVGITGIVNLTGSHLVIA